MASIVHASPPDEFSPLNESDLSLQLSSRLANCQRRSLLQLCPQEDCNGFGKEIEFLSASESVCSALNTALDVWVLGLSGQDDDVHTRDRLYGDALLQLRDNICAILDCQLDAVVGAIHVLQVIESSNSVAIAQSNWRLHAGALDPLLGKRTPISRQPGFSRLLSSNFRLFGFWNALSSPRKLQGLYMDDPSLLNTVAHNLPSLLEEYTQMCNANRQDLYQIGFGTIVDRLQQAEESLQNWSATWNCSMKHARYRLIPSTASMFPNQLEKRDEAAFTHNFEFKSLSDALDHIMCSACLMAIACALRGIAITLSADPQSDPEASSADIIRLQQSATKYADLICMGLPYIGQECHGSYGLMLLSGPLSLVTTWYKYLQKNDTSKASEAHWCEAATRKLESQRVRLLTSDEPRWMEVL